MRRTLLALPLAALAIVGWPSTNASAQETKTARGTVTAIAADSVTVKAGTQDMKFVVDAAKTTVEAIGAGTASRAAQAEGKPGPKLSEVIKVGQAVEVSYREAGGVMNASRIRAISSAGSGGGGVVAATPGTKTSNGTVKSLAGSALTISGSSGGGATFEQTFAIDGTTKVIGKGVGTATAPTGGRGQLSELVKAGDTVSVSYHETGSTLHAAEIRVTVKASAK